MRDRVKVFYSSVRKDNSKIELGVLLQCGLRFRSLYRCWSIFRVNSIENVRPCGLHSFGVVAKLAKGLLRPEPIAGTHIPSPTPTLGQPLRLRQITFAPP